MKLSEVLKTVDYFHIAITVHCFGNNFNLCRCGDISDVYPYGYKIG